MFERNEKHSRGLLLILLLVLQYYSQVPSKITSELDIMSIKRVTLSKILEILHKKLLTFTGLAA